MNVSTMLLLAGLYHRPAFMRNGQRHPGKREVYVIDTNESLGLFNALEAAQIAKDRLA